MRETTLVLEDASDRPAVVDIGRHDASIRFESVRIGPSPAVGLRVRDPGAVVSLDGIEVADVTGDRAAVVVTSAAHAVARSVVVRDTRAGPDGRDGQGIRIEESGRLELRRALVARNRTVGVFVGGDGAEALLEDVVIRGTEARLSDGAFGRGLQVQLGARAELRGGLLERNRDVAVFVGVEGAEAVLEHLVIRDTQAQRRDGAFGRGLAVEFGARAELRHGLIERNRDIGVWMIGEGSEAVLEDFIVRDTLARQSDGALGRGVSVELGARVALRRGLLERNRDAAVFVGSAGAEAELEDLVVRETLADGSDGSWGRGLNVQLGARVALRRGLLERNRDVAIFVGFEGTVALVEDVVVRGTLAQETDGNFGRGLGVEEGARVELWRGLFEGNRDVGVFVSRDGAEAMLGDLVVRDTLPRESDGAFGRGMAVELGASATLSRGLVERAHEVGVAVSGEGAAAVLEDLVVRDTLPRHSDGALGQALGVERGARVEMRRGLLERNREVGVLLAGQAAVDAEDVVIRDTAGPACRPGCEGRPPGVSVGAFFESAVQLDRFDLARGEVCGLLIGEDGVRPGGGGFRLSDGVVRDHPIAVCLQHPDFPLALLQQGVRYRDNRVLVEATGFPEPELVDLIEP
ncbi:MAG: hypothetical protein ACFCGT_27080 [Sandaracinaceae bacterium]